MSDAEPKPDHSSSLHAWFPWWLDHRQRPRPGSQVRAGRVRHHQAHGRTKGIRGHVLGERPRWASPGLLKVVLPGQLPAQPDLPAAREHCSRWQAPPGRPPLPPGHQHGQPAAGQRAAASGLGEAPAGARRPHGTACRRSARLTRRATVPHVAVFLSAPLSRSRTSRLGRPCGRRCAIGIRRTQTRRPLARIRRLRGRHGRTWHPLR
jgi:hypothetical protein